MPVPTTQPAPASFEIGLQGHGPAPVVNEVSFNIVAFVVYYNDRAPTPSRGSEVMFPNPRDKDAPPVDECDVGGGQWTLFPGGSAVNADFVRGNSSSLLEVDKPTPNAVPTEVHVITTYDGITASFNGKNTVVRGYTCKRDGVFHRFARGTVTGFNPNEKRGFIQVNGSDVAVTEVGCGDAESSPSGPQRPDECGSDVGTKPALWLRDLQVVTE
jgi:hypothetical protein